MLGIFVVELGPRRHAYPLAASGRLLLAEVRAPRREVTAHEERTGAEPARLAGGRPRGELSDGITPACSRR
jgi:hypothetical protein